MCNVTLSLVTVAGVGGQSAPPNLIKSREEPGF